MDASDDTKSAEDGGITAGRTTAEYNSSSIKKARLESTLAALLSDPVLADVPMKPSLSDVDTLINLELGSAMRLTVLKMDGTSFDVAVMNTATVKDLKLAVKKKVDDMEESAMGHRHISWNRCFLEVVELPGVEAMFLLLSIIMLLHFFDYSSAVMTLWRDMCGLIFVCHTTTRSYSMTILRFTIMASETTLRCNLFLMLFQKLLEGTLGAGSIVSSTV